MFEVKSENKITHIYFNGVDISEMITSFEIKQDAWEYPELIIRCNARNLKVLSDKIEKIKIEEEK